MINEIIVGTKGKKYTVIKRLFVEQGNRPNANIYLCKDEDHTKYILKHFYERSPVSFIGYCKYNHYGRRRDGSWKVFNEIQQKNLNYEFLLKHFERIRHNKRWLIILEYIEGDTLADFIKNNYKENFAKVELGIKCFASTLREWHEASFAHGDAHLDNVMISRVKDNYAIKLIDYGQLHHPDFYYCKKLNCYKIPHKRLMEDIENNSNKLGRGFLEGLIVLENALNISNKLSQIFKSEYTKFLGTNTNAFSDESF